MLFDIKQIFFKFKFSCKSIIQLSNLKFMGGGGEFVLLKIKNTYILKYACNLHLRNKKKTI